MKKFVLVFEEKIVTHYEGEQPMPFGGPWSKGISLEVPEGINIDQAEIAEDINGKLYIYERELTEEETFQKEVEESESYVADIQKGQRAVAFFRLLNDKKGLTSEQKLQAISTPSIQAILQMLTIGKLPEAISMIRAIEADGVIVTETDKQKLIKFLGE
jgi:hypothetical protein